jgi:hypothetical protein
VQSGSRQLYRAREGVGDPVSPLSNRSALSPVKDKALSCYRAFGVMTLRVVDPAQSDPVSLVEAKAQLRVTDASNDMVIKGLIPAATKFVRSIVQRVFMQQTLEWVLPCWRGELCIPVAPVVSGGIRSIKYVDWTTQTQQTLDPVDYVVQPRGPSVVIIPKFGGFWPLVFAHSPEPIVVQFEAG